MARGPLEVWLYGTHAAWLFEDGDRLAMRWTAEAAQRWPINFTVLSVLLPLTPEHPPHPARARAFFAGLMPEGEARVQLALEAGVAPDDVFGMMHAYGREPRRFECGAARGRAGCHEHLVGRHATQDCSAPRRIRALVRVPGRCSVHAHHQTGPAA